MFIFLYSFLEAAAAAMILALQILPLALHTLVALHLRHRLSPLESVAAELLDEVGKDESVGPLVAILRQHAYQDEVYGVSLMPLQYLEQLEPAQRQQLAIANLLKAAVSDGKETPKPMSLLP